MFEIEGKYTEAKIFAEDVDETCISQIYQFTNHPAFTKPVAVMPDTHAGKGSVIGFTMELPDKVIPDTIGVDIGCGMLSINIGKNALNKISSEKLDTSIREAIPFGMNVHTFSKINFQMEFPWAEVNEAMRKLQSRYLEIYRIKASERRDWDEREFVSVINKVHAKRVRVFNSIGSLGGGNHFIEIGKSDVTDDYWVTIHSGSRGFGLAVCNYWQKVARKNVEDKRSDLYRKEISKIREETQDRNDIPRKIENLRKKLGLEDYKKGLEFLVGEELLGYLYDMIFAQIYAAKNRRVMADIIRNILNCDIIDEIETVHNYIDFRDFIIRKGAIRSYKGERVVIPFNQRDGLIICIGKSNKEWNFSAPHGAGRVLSRSKAKQILSLDTFKKQMEGIFSTSICDNTLDESPDSYKDTESIKRLIEPTAEIIDTIKPIHNLKSV